MKKQKMSRIKYYVCLILVVFMILIPISNSVTISNIFNASIRENKTFLVIEYINRSESRLYRTPPLPESCTLLHAKRISPLEGDNDMRCNDVFDGGIFSSNPNEIKGKPYTLLR